MAFWHQLLLCMKSIGMMQSTTYPCLYHKWGEEGLVLIVSGIDGNLIIGPKKAVKKTKKDLSQLILKLCRFNFTNVNSNLHNNVIM
jgi:hypothetical protein